MTKAELNEAIPPAYTEWIGGQLMIGVVRPLRRPSRAAQVMVMPGHRRKLNRSGVRMWSGSNR